MGSNSARREAMPIGARDRPPEAEGMASARSRVSFPGPEESCAGQTSTREPGRTSCPELRAESLRVVAIPAGQRASLGCWWAIVGVQSFDQES